jgi:hypothetical protein
MSRTGFTSAIKQTWLQQSQAAKREAQKLPPGIERELLLRKAQLETASHMNEWLSSPGLRQPR